MRRAARLILSLSLVPAVCGCGARTADAPPPLPKEALAAVAEQPGAQREKLARAVDAFFTDPKMGQTRALLVLRDGKVVAERYAPDFDARTPLIGWSMSKTVTAILIGLLVADGRLTLDAPAPVPAWRQVRDPRGAITLRHLLQMRSGLRHNEGVRPPFESSEVRMLYLDGRDDTARWAEGQPLVADPGTTFQYSTATAVILADIAARTLAPSGDPAARQRAVAGYLADRVFKPLDLTSMRGEFDAAGTLLGGSMIYATARDWAKVGEFLRNDGVAKGTQVVPSGWVRFMRTPSPADPGYGGQIWLNRERPKGREEVLFPGDGPPNLFALVGHDGQYVVVSPDQRLTVVRLGRSNKAQNATVREGLVKVVGLYR